MKINNPFAARQFTIGQALFTLWFIVATVLAVVYLKALIYEGVYQKGVAAGFEEGARQGRLQTVGALIQNSQSCDPVTVKLENQAVNLLNTACLPTGEAAEVEIGE